jgi:predicted dehydrogenase
MAALKVGIIGVGGIARTHVPGWKDSEHAELVAGSDLDAEALNTWGEANGVKTLHTDSKDLIADPDIDIVDICTPNMSHVPLTIAALEAGKHVICEKPLAPTPDGVRKMIAARDKSGKMLMTAQHFRFNSSARALKAEIDAGTLGDIYHARSWMLRRAGLITRPSFITKAQAGGGPCIDIGVHILDLTLWMMGNPEPVAVTGVARKELADIPGAFTSWSGAEIPPNTFDVEEFAAAFVRFANGAVLILEVSWLLHHKAPKEDMQMWLYGTKAGSHWPSCELVETNYQSKQFYDRTLGLTTGGMEPHALECVEFAKAVAEGAPSPVPAEQSLQVMKILDGIYRSQETGGEVSV